jgi:hypothetical protein
MATLTNTQISVTYVGLLKTSANTVLSSTAQQITDGSGNNSIIFLSTAGVGIGGAAASGKELDVTGNVLITGDLQVDNINIDGNTISSTAGTDLNITPLAGQQIVLDGTIVIDAGVVTGATSITSTAFVGALTGDVTGNADTATKIASITNSNIVQLTSSQTLTNKTIDVDNNTVSNIEVDNLKSGVLDTDLSSVSSSDDTLASAKAIKTYVDAQVDTADTLSEILAIGNTTGATKISVNNTSSGIDFIDDAKARFGTGNDLEIYHDGTDSFIKNNTGLLRIEQNVTDGDIQIKADDGGGSETTYIFCDGSTGKVELSNTGIKKLETTPQGIGITGEVELGDGTANKIQFIGGQGNWRVNISDSANQFVIHSESLAADYFTVIGGGGIKLNAYGSGSKTGTVAKNLAVDSSGNIIETDGGVVDGSGTANDVAMWSDSNTLTDAPIAISGNNATFAGTLDVTSTSNFTGQINVGSVVPRIDSTFSLGSNSLRFASIYGDGLTITNNATFGGSVGIGETSLSGGNTTLDLKKTGTDVGTNIRFKNDYNSNLYIGISGDSSGNVIIYNQNNSDIVMYTGSSGTERMRIDSSGNSTFAGKILVGTGATAAASLNAYTQTVSSNLFSALRVIENSGASSYWDIGATGGSSTLLNFYHNGNTTAKISFTHTGGATFAGQIQKTSASTGVTEGDIVINTTGGSGAGRLIFKDAGTARANVAYSHDNDNLELIAQKSDGGFKVFTGGLNERLGISSSGTATFAGTIEHSSSASGNVVGALLKNTNQSGSADSVSLNLGLGRTADSLIFSIPVIKLLKEQQWTGTGSTIDGALVFSTIENETIAEKMRLDSSGNVGITAAASFRFNGTGDNTHAVGYDSTIDGSFLRGQLGMRFLTGTGGGTERMRITSAGDINILNATATDSKSIGITNAAGTTGWTFGNGVLSNTHQFVIYDNTAGSPRILIDSSGNVGIGTTLPTHQMHIHTDNDNTYALRIQGSTDNGAGVWTGIGISGENANTKSAIIFQDIGVSYARGKLLFCVNNEQNQNSASPSDAKITISNDGNVGIGTTLPRVQNEIYGTGQLTSAISDSGNTGATLSLSSNQNSANSGGCLLFGALNDSGNTKPQASIKSLLTNGNSQGIGDLAFSTRAATGDTALTERMRIDSQGNVGIGKSASDGAKLHTYNNSTDAYNIFESSANKWVFGEAGGVCQIGGLYGTHNGIQVNTSGDVLIGASGTSNLYLGNIITAGSSNRGMRLHTNNADVYFDFQGDSSTTLFFRDYDGSGGTHSRHSFDLQAGGAVFTGSLTQNGSISDKKYKENIKTISNGIDKIQKLNPVEFDWNDKSDAHKIGKKEDAGFIAQEVQKVLPNLVNENVDGDLALNYEGIIPYLVQSIQELKKK